MSGGELKGAFRGETRRSLRSGFGVYQYPNPFFQYEGTWREGKKHGFGKLLFSDGSYYQGEFVNNEIIGQGTRYFASSGNTYTGHFHYGEMDGQGRLRLGNGDSYEGNFKSNHFEGEGSYLSHDKELYSGTWHNHRRHGLGEQTYANGTQYIGDWIADKRHGFGKLLNGVDDTLIYEGSWRNDLMHGEGTYSIGESYTYQKAMLVNGVPVGWPFRLCINKNKATTLQLSEQPLTINVDIVDSSDNMNRVNADCGRLIRLRCGQRTNQPTSDSLPTPFGFHVDLVPRKSKSSLPNDPSALESIEQPITTEEPETNKDSMFTACDSGRAQFVGITIDTFAVREANSSEPSSTTNSNRQKDKSTSSFVFIIDDVTQPVPFDKTLDSVYIPVQFSLPKFSQ
ncbi:unnamed protein product [Adineta ricciae]|uniref:MORN repeat-containing protein 1 n=1 Tax=Adineta ricciae TaxID=249248 RepID=A0A813SKD7_ADIRI|nr:unnamed protein product [Adineta ricciae]CAF0924618.1 unnamed protein product [Adineta ricciae]